MTRRAYIYFMLTFLLGVLVGAAGVFAYGWYWGRWHRGFDRVQHLKRELQLSDQQVQQLNQIMDEFGRKFAELRQEVRPRFDALRRESHDRVRAILTPEQQRKYDDMERQHERREDRPRSP